MFGGFEHTVSFSFASMVICQATPHTHHANPRAFKSQTHFDLLCYWIFLSKGSTFLDNPRGEKHGSAFFPHLLLQNECSICLLLAQPCTIIPQACVPNDNSPGISQLQLVGGKLSKLYGKRIMHKRPILIYCCVPWTSDSEAYTCELYSRHISNCLSQPEVHWIKRIYRILNLMNPIYSRRLLYVIAINNWKPRVLVMDHLNSNTYLPIFLEDKNCFGIMLV